MPVAWETISVASSLEFIDYGDFYPCCRHRLWCLPFPYVTINSSFLSSNESCDPDLPSVQPHICPAPNQPLTRRPHTVPPGIIHPSPGTGGDAYSRVPFYLSAVWVLQEERGGGGEEQETLELFLLPPSASSENRVEMHQREEKRGPLAFCSSSEAIWLARPVAETQRGCTQQWPEVARAAGDLSAGDQSDDGNTFPLSSGDPEQQEVVETPEVLTGRGQVVIPMGSRWQTSTATPSSARGAAAAVILNPKGSGLQRGDPPSGSVTSTVTVSPSDLEGNSSIPPLDNVATPSMGSVKWRLQSKTQKVYYFQVFNI